MVSPAPLRRKVHRGDVQLQPVAAVQQLQRRRPGSGAAAGTRAGVEAEDVRTKGAFWRSDDLICIWCMLIYTHARMCVCV